jgi:hypothetical protein
MQTRRKRNIKGAGIDWYLKNKAKRSSVVPSKYDNVLDQTVTARKNKKGSQSSRSIRHRVGQFVKSMRPRNDARVHTKDDVWIGSDEIVINMGEHGGRKLRKLVKKKQDEIDSAGVVIDLSANGGRKSRKLLKKKQDEIGSAEVVVMMGENGGRKSRKR